MASTRAERKAKRKARRQQLKERVLSALGSDKVQQAYQSGQEAYLGQLFDDDVVRSAVRLPLTKPRPERDYLPIILSGLFILGAAFIARR
jgi:hypothetical protein